MEVVGNNAAQISHHNPDKPQTTSTFLPYILSWWSNGQEDGEFAPITGRAPSTIIWPLFYVLLFLLMLYTFISERVLNFTTINPSQGPESLLDRQIRRRRIHRRWSSFPWRLLWPSRNYVLEYPEVNLEEEQERYRDQLADLRHQIETCSVFMLIFEVHVFVVKFFWEEVRQEVEDWLEFRRRVEARGRGEIPARIVPAVDENNEEEDDEDDGSLIDSADSGESSGEDKLEEEDEELTTPTQKPKKKTAAEVEKANWLHFLTTCSVFAQEDFEICTEFRTDVDKLVQLTEMVDLDLNLDLDLAQSLIDDNVGEKKDQDTQQCPAEKMASATESSSSSSHHLPSSASSSSTSTSTTSSATSITSSSSSSAKVKKATSEDSDDSIDW